MDSFRDECTRSAFHRVLPVGEEVNNATSQFTIRTLIVGNHGRGEVTVSRCAHTDCEVKARGTESLRQSFNGFLLSRCSVDAQPVQEVNTIDSSPVRRQVKAHDGVPPFGSRSFFRFGVGTWRIHTGVGSHDNTLPGVRGNYGARGTGHAIKHHQLFCPLFQGAAG